VVQQVEFVDMEIQVQCCAQRQEPRSSSVLLQESAPEPRSSRHESVGCETLNQVMQENQHHDIIARRCACGCCEARREGLEEMRHWLSRSNYRKATVLHMLLSASLTTPHSVSKL
jgi:hypothetical protein